MKYQARMARPLTTEQMAVYRHFGFSEKLSRLLFIRGIDSKEKVEQFFDFSLDRLHNPFLLKGMKEAVERINRAAEAREKILIIGDYDADGICSVAILYKYLLTRHVSTRYFLPDRDADGYGLTCDLITKLNKRFEPNLIITVDSGISCHKEIEYAKSLGIDCIVTDHHTIPEKTPDCICIDPKFTDQKYPFNELCGAGVSLKLVQALGGMDAAVKYIDICAIATVADIVSLTDENRVIVTHGLEMLNNNSLPSITALARSCNIWGKITSSDISFKIGPKINASGRMGNAKRGLDVILEQDESEIEKIITSLTNYNIQRQKLCNTIFDEADTAIEAQQLYKNNIIIVADEHWESGVLGIVSARITEKFGKPSIIFSKTENVYKGSSRSVGEVNIVKTIELFKDLVLTYGGHSMAAGLSVASDVFLEFVEKITSHLNSNFSAVELTGNKFYDFALDKSDITAEFVRELRQLEPTGCENAPPSFVTEIFTADTNTMNNYPQHLRFTHNGLHLMYFGGAGNADILEAYFPKDIVFEFQKYDASRDGTNRESGRNVSNDGLRAVVKAIMPRPTDARAYALTLYGWLLNHFSVPDNDEKFESIISALSVDRDVFITYYKAIKSVRTASNIYDMFTKANDIAGGLNLYQFVFCAAVFAELKIFSLSNGRVTINDKISTDLFRSAAYNLIRTKPAAAETDIKFKYN